MTYRITKYKNQLLIINKHALTGGENTAKGIIVNLMADSVDKRGAWCVIFHEFGHRIDMVTGRKSIHSELKNKLKEDFEDIVRKYKEMYNCTDAEAYKGISSSIRHDKFHSISDLFGGLTKNKCKGRYSHNDNYWNYPGTLEKEAFAHFFSAYSRNDEEEIMLLKLAFPKAFAEFERILEEIVL